MARPTQAEREERIRKLKGIIERNMPNMVEVAASEVDTVCMSQLAFAGDYQPEEYLLLGMTIKYLGLAGKDVLIGATRDKEENQQRRATGFREAWYERNDEGKEDDRKI